MNRLLCRGRQYLLICSSLLFMIIMSVFGILWIKSNVITVEYKLSQMEDRKRALLREQRVLLAEKASLTNISRLRQGELYSLNFPDRRKVVYITKDSRISLNKVSLNQRD